MSTNSTEDAISWAKEEEALDMFFLVIGSVFIVPTILGNSLIVISILRFRHIRRIKHYMMIGNLAVSDLLVGLVVLPIQIFSALTKDGPGPFLNCLVIICMTYTCFAASVLNLFILSLERFHAIRYPLLHPTRVTRKRLYIVIAFTWTFVIALGFYPLLSYMWRDVVPKICNAQCVYSDVYRRFFISVVLFCIFVSCVMYFTIFKIAVRKMKVFTDLGGGHAGYQTHRMLRKDMRHSRVMLLISGLFVLFWGPYCLCVIITVNDEQLMYIRSWLSGLGLINSCINWIVFGARLKTFREAFKNIFNCSFLNPDFQLRSSIIS